MNRRELFQGAAGAGIVMATGIGSFSVVVPPGRRVEMALLTDRPVLQKTVLDAAVRSASRRQSLRDIEILGPTRRLDLAGAPYQFTVTALAT